MPLETDPAAGCEPLAGSDVDAGDDDRAEYHALELGAGRPVVLLHDLYSSHEAFTAVTERLADDWRVISVDLPGHGLSSRPGEFADLAAVAVELGSVLDEFAALPAAVVGMGVGATVAVELAAARPADITALVLVGAGLGAESEIWAAAAVAGWLAGSRSADELADALMPVLYGERFFADQPGLASAERRRLSSLDPADVAPVARAAAATGDRLDRLASVAAPLVVVAGESDALVTPARLDAIAAHAAAGVVRLPWTGHSAVLERPAEVAAAIGDFLRDR